MRKSAQAAPWAVYQMTVQGQPGPKVVCYQNEWQAIEQATPGLHRLIKDGIWNEGEAERLARGTSGDDPVRIPRKKLIAEMLEAEPDVIVEAESEESQEDAGPILLPFSAVEESDDLSLRADEKLAQGDTWAGGEVA